LGNNGSGKSTLLKIISSFITQSKGEVIYTKDGNLIPTDLIPFQICCCSPFIELEGNYSLDELFDFHFSLRTIKTGYCKESFFELCYLTDAQFKKVKELSSGMTQRLKLAFTFLTESSLILLDEPCMNLDKNGVEMYTSFIKNLGDKTTQIVASNSIIVEYEHCNAEITL
ncbi:MAG: ABC-type multidrug transport system ATPase subunit, partial [Flavobacteriales bacterium]